MCAAHDIGSRVNGSPIQFKSHGPDLAAVVDVLSNTITGTNGENPILINWIGDLHRAARHALLPVITIDEVASAEAPSDSKRIRKSTSKRSLLDAEAEAKEEGKRRKKAAQEETEDMKRRTEGKCTFNVEDLRIIDVPKGNKGPKTDPLLDLLTYQCEVISNTKKKRWLCKAKNCGVSGAYPRSRDRVLPHAMECRLHTLEIREQAAAASAKHSLSAQIENIDQSNLDTVPGPSAQPSVHAIAQAEGREKRKLVHNSNVLRLVCALSIPPTVVDSAQWNDLVVHLDPRMEGASGSTLASGLIPSKAAFVRSKSIETLRQYTHLTLLFDGATTRANESIYTVHVTTPDTREAHLICGDEATGKSHTGEHLKNMLKDSMHAIGPERFSGACSDCAGNTRLARELLAELFPWIIELPDPCHHMNNTAKDLCEMSIFTDANSKLRIVIRFFRKSSSASHHLNALRVLVGIAKGLIAIGKTRFLTIYYAIKALLPCIPLMVDLLRTNVIRTTPTHPLAFLKDPQARRSFVDALQLEMALLEPFARSVKCLESNESIKAELMITDAIASEVRQIVNGRSSEMLEGPDQQVYLTTLFLDPHYLGSPLFLRKNINPLSTKITIKPRTTLDPHVAALSDADLRQSMPTYLSAGKYLGELLRHEIKSGRLPDTITRSYSTPSLIFEEFRTEFEAYVRQKAPFNRYHDSATAFEYWNRLSRHFDACVLSYLAIKLYSIVPNSMAEERTVSNFTKLNSPDRGRQKASTIVFMTQIKQDEHRDEISTRPTVRFRDLSEHLKQVGEPTVKLSGEGLSDTEANSSQEGVDTWEAEAGFDEVIPAARGAGGEFKSAMSEGVDLREGLLRDLLSDDPIPGVVERGGARNLQPKASASLLEPSSPRLICRY
ncbi:hypothetical protein RhiJN_11814 [Ceratobasidium sp. AG-Ba]|nr:hypothetical protein RhiJN_11814 [Ceratobasidium sp. AG-Ba]